MKRAFLRALLARRAAIKQLWHAALQNTTTHTPLANPDLLAYMMDETLDELLLNIWYTRFSPRSQDITATSLLTKNPVGCGLNPYIAYFLAGESALVSVTRGIKPSAQLAEGEILRAEIELLFAFRDLGNREINAFCEVCRIQSPSDVGGMRNTLPKACPFKGTAVSAPSEITCPR